LSYPSFFVKYFKKIKALHKKLKGLEFLGSSDCNIDRTFRYKFYFQTAAKKPSISKKTYRNPFYLAKEYKKMIDS